MPEGSLILVVDDEHLVRYALQLKLCAAGFRARGAQDGKEGLELALKERPALIITDQDMPRMSGLQMAAELRRHDQTSGLPIVFLTAGAASLPAAQLAQLKITKVLNKPFVAGDVVSLITQILA